MKNAIDEPINELIMRINGATVSGNPYSGIPITIAGLSQDEMDAVIGKDHDSPMLCNVGHMHGLTQLGNTTYGFLLNSDGEVDSSNSLVICGNGTTPADWENLLKLFGDRAQIIVDPDWVVRHRNAMLELLNSSTIDELHAMSEDFDRLLGLSSL